MASVMRRTVAVRASLEALLGEVRRPAIPHMGR